MSQCAMIRAIFGVIFLPPIFIEGERSRQARERSRKAVRSSIGKLKVLIWVIKAHAKKKRIFFRVAKAPEIF